MRADVIGRVNEFLAGHRRDSLSLSFSLAFSLPRSTFLSRRRREIKHTFSHERNELRSRRDTCSLLCRVIDFTAGRFYFTLCRAWNRFTSPAQWPTWNNRPSLHVESHVHDEHESRHGRAPPSPPWFLDLIDHACGLFFFPPRSLTSSSPSRFRNCSTLHLRAVLPLVSIERRLKRPKLRLTGTMSELRFAFD